MDEDRYSEYEPEPQELDEDLNKFQYFNDDEDRGETLIDQQDWMKKHKRVKYFNKRNVGNVSMSSIFKTTIIFDVTEYVESLIIDCDNEVKIVNRSDNQLFINSLEISKVSNKLKLIGDIKIGYFSTDRDISVKFDCPIENWKDTNVKQKIKKLRFFISDADDLQYLKKMIISNVEQIKLSIGQFRGYRTTIPLEFNYDSDFEVLSISKQNTWKHTYPKIDIINLPRNLDILVLNLVFDFYSDIDKSFMEKLVILYEDPLAVAPGHMHFNLSRTVDEAELSRMINDMNEKKDKNYLTITTLTFPINLRHLGFIPIDLYFDSTDFSDQMMIKNYGNSWPIKRSGGSITYIVFRNDIVDELPQEIRIIIRLNNL